MQSQQTNENAFDANDYGMSYANEFMNINFECKNLMNLKNNVKTLAAAIDSVIRIPPFFEMIHDRNPNINGKVSILTEKANAMQTAIVDRMNDGFERLDSYPNSQLIIDEDTKFYGLIEAHESAMTDDRVLKYSCSTVADLKPKTEHFVRAFGTCQLSFGLSIVPNFNYLREMINRVKQNQELVNVEDLANSFDVSISNISSDDTEMAQKFLFRCVVDEIQKLKASIAEKSNELNRFYQTM